VIRNIEIPSFDSCSSLIGDLAAVLCLRRSARERIERASDEIDDRSFRKCRTMKNLGILRRWTSARRVSGQVPAG
jgi:hypothetical protein